MNKKSNFFSDDILLKDLKIGTKFSFIKNINLNDTQVFAKIIKDKNPLHLKSKVKKNKDIISHGLFTSSLIGTLLGTYCPIKNNLLVSLKLDFKKPVYSGYRLKIEGKIIKKIEELKLVTIDIKLSNKNIPVLEGVAIIKILH